MYGWMRGKKEKEGERLTCLRALSSMARASGLMEWACLWRAESTSSLTTPLTLSPTPCSTLRGKMNNWRSLERDTGKDKILEGDNYMGEKKFFFRDIGEKTKFWVEVGGNTKGHSETKESRERDRGEEKRFE